MLKKLISLLPFVFLAYDSGGDSSAENINQNNFTIELVSSVSQINVPVKFFNSK